MDDHFLQKVIAQSSIGYACHKIILDKTGRPIDYQFLDINPAFEQIIGLKREQVINRKLTEIIPNITNDDFKWIDFYGEIALRTGSKEIEQYSDALNKWFRVQVCSPEKNYFITLVTDITPQKRAEQTLRQSEAKFKQYIDNAPDGIFIIDITGHYREVNPAGCALLGYTEAEILSMGIKDVAVPENLQEGGGFHILVKYGSVKKDTILKTKDGRGIPVRLDAVKLPDGQFMGFVKDISERKQAETEKELYYRSIQSLHQPIIITDTNGIILEINQAFSDMYGYSKDEVQGKDPKILNPGRQVYMNLGYTSDEYNQLFRGLWLAIKNPSVGTWENNVINRKKDGTLVWVKLLINAIYNSRHEIINFIGLPIDISKTKQLEKLGKIELYKTIADLAELRDSESGNHMRRVGIFAKMIAKALHQSEKYCDDIEIFAPMHDIGKVGILDSILLAERKLTIEEFNEMKKHTILGYNIVKGKKELDMVAAITLNHHEYFNGKGYPHGISGENIPLSARITAVADVYDALRSRRPYKAAWSHEDTKNEIINNAGTQFDPQLITIFMELHKAFETAYQELED